MGDTPVAIRVNGADLEAAPGATVLEACTAAGIDVPTLCWAANLTPVNACRLCVVELEGSRPLVPASLRGKLPRVAATQNHTKTTRKNTWVILRVVVMFIISTALRDSRIENPLCRPRRFRPWR